jgi:hypothetical protein
MANEPDSWINTPAFRWTPETPLRLEPQFVSSENVNVIVPAVAAAEISEPHFAPAAQPASAPEVEILKPRPAPAAADVKAAQPRLFLSRLGVGLAQGALLMGLFAARAILDPYIFSAALMVFLFAPLLMLAGLGRMRVRPLLIWTGFAALLLAATGAYHHWRTLSSDGGHPGLALLILTTLFLFAGQSLAQSAVGDYPAHYRSAWRLAIRIVLCALFAGLAWASAGAALGFMREHYPALAFAPLILPLVALSAAIAAQLTGERFLGALQEGAVFVFTLALPFLLLLGIAVAGLGVAGRWQASLAVSAGLCLMLIIAINASYRDGTSWRPYWQRRLEFAASLLLVPLSLLGGFALASRIQQYGWTDTRIFAAAALLLMTGYAFCYAGAALISLGGGGWMQRIEGNNLAMAFAGMALIVALASPIADPARLAVEAQRFRLEQHSVTADAFDFTWLRDGGLRFGHEALAQMAATKSATARGAFEALAAKPSGERPTPTEIGANIHVHSAPGLHDGVLPAGLLARDWSGVAGAPPCLTSAALGCDAFFSDLDGDGRSEIILAYGTDARWWAAVMKQGLDAQGNMNGGWYVAGTLAAPPCPGGLDALRAGHFTAVRPAASWRDLVVDGIRLSVQPANPGPAALPVACPLT